MNLERTKYIIVRHIDGAVLCGTTKQTEFVRPEKIDNQRVKLYRSAETALAAARMAGVDESKVFAEKVFEKIETV